MEKLINVLWNCFHKILYSIIRASFRVVGKEQEENVFESIIQFVKFGIVGLSNTIISYVIYVIGLMVLQKNNLFPEFDYLLSQFVAFVLSVLWSFYWNNRIVFVLEAGKKRSFWKSLIKTFISYSFTGIFLSSVLLVIWVKVFDLSEFIAPIINLLISVPLNFFINKFWAFKQT